MNLPRSRSSSSGTASAAERSAAAGGDGDRSAEFYLDPATVRRADTSAASINEWTGERVSRDADVSDDIRPASVGPLGNYAVCGQVSDRRTRVLGYKCRRQAYARVCVCS